MSMASQLSVALSEEYVDSDRPFKRFVPAEVLRLFRQNRYRLGSKLSVKRVRRIFDPRGDRKVTHAMVRRMLNAMVKQGLLSKHEPGPYSDLDAGDYIYGLTKKGMKDW